VIKVAKDGAWIKAVLATPVENKPGVQLRLQLHAARDRAEGEIPPFQRTPAQVLTSAPGVRGLPSRLTGHATIFEAVQTHHQTRKACDSAA
jgi:hypothetical protein